MIKSPLRYPGGKSKAIDQIAEYIPDSFSEYREPFVGGGSVFIYLKQKFPHFKFWINDLNRFFMRMELRTSSCISGGNSRFCF